MSDYDRENIADDVLDALESWLKAREWRNRRDADYLDDLTEREKRREAIMALLKLTDAPRMVRMESSDDE